MDEFKEGPEDRGDWDRLNKKQSSGDEFREVIWSLGHHTHTSKNMRIRGIAFYPCASGK